MSTPPAKFCRVPLRAFISVMGHKIVDFAIDILIAMAVFYTGRFIISRLYKFVNHLLEKRNADRSLSTFLLWVTGRTRAGHESRL